MSDLTIKKVESWETSDGRRFGTQEEAQEWVRLTRLREWFEGNVMDESSTSQQLAEWFDRDFTCLPRERP